MTEYLKRRRATVQLDQNSPLPTDVLPLIQVWLDGLPEESTKYRYLKDTVFSKFVSKDTDPANLRRDRAISKWLFTETVNQETNDRLLSTPDDTVLLPSVRFGPFCDFTRGVIRGIIGDMPTDLFGGSFSGGASTSRTRTAGHPALKYVGKAHVTQTCLDMLEEEEWPTWSNLGLPTLEIVEGSHIFTVLKDTVIDRVACKEPDVNMYLQKGFGKLIRRALRKVGNNLNDQSRNKDLARIGSITGDLATLDLSSASDSISYELIASLLPPLWFSALNGCRSHKVLIDGEWHHCEMFSSMGNGFTFELESLIFLALARATAYFTGTKGVISVYGDDIICPSSMFEPLRHILFYFGFSLNTTKSFSTGPFRESCGGHYSDGDDITPFFIRRPIDRLSDLIHFLNSLRKWASQGQMLYLDDEAYVLWDLLSELVPRSLKGGDIVSAGKYQLISPDWPRKRLSPVQKSRVLNDQGKYLHWLNVNEYASGDLVLSKSEDDKVILGACRYKPAPRWTWHCSGLHFLTEDLTAASGGETPPVETGG